MAAQRRTRHPWRTKEMRELFDAISALETPGGAGDASSGTCARCRSSRRWRTAGRWRGWSSRGCRTWRSRERTGASTTTVTRVAHWLRHGEGGYRLALDRAMPPEGRGPGRRGGCASRRSACSRTPASARSSRATARSRFRAATRRSRCCSCARPTCPSTCRTASSTAGSPGIDLVRERGGGRARAAAARLRLVPARGRRSRGVARHARSRIWPGAAVATVYPRLTRELLPVDVTLVDVSGSVEIAPRLGLADAIVDLVSSGNTLRTNGLRSLGALLESEAVLVARETTPRGQLVAAMLRAVVEARRHRYLMLNAPESALARDLRARRPARRRACCRSRSRGWSPCTRSSRPQTSGGCCRDSRRPARRRS